MEDISVIMPVYNGVPHMDTAIRSILEQREVDLRLYICDDASTDDSWTLIRAWAERDNRIVALQNEKNRGAAGARNRCLSAAKGRYYALMDSDDYSHPDRLKTQLAYLESRAGLAFTGTRGRYFHRVPGDLTEDYWFVRKPEPKDFLMTLPFVNGSLLLRREALDAVGEYDERAGIKRSEDYDLLMRLYAAGCRGENIDEAYYFIRLDDDTYRRRRYRYRLNECRVKWRGFSRMGLMPRAVPYALKPLAVGLIPRGVLEHMKRGYYRDR